MDHLDTAKAIVVALMLFLGASVSPATPAEQDTPEVGLWQRVVSAVQAPIAQLRQQSLESTLGTMDDVRIRLSLRAASANRRATAGALSALELAGKIPPGIRGAGEHAILEFLDNRHLSHVQSVKNYPQLAADLDNLVFESPRWNLARNARDMEFLEKLRANAHNAGASLKAGRFVLLAKTGQGCIAGGLLELPVTAVEKALDIANERTAPDEAVRSGLQSVATTAVLGCAASGVVLAGASLAGVTVGAPILVPLAVIGGVAYVWVSSDRIWNALEEEERRVVLNQLAAVQDAVLGDDGAPQATIVAGTQFVLQRVRAASTSASGWW